ncbi:hypothetical protein [Simkania negevensis]|uniref:Uncharacterized protein n=1 Tax=Simkania negevensis (strain ATCC VR-1471 / DSM 27360 / Z) TaxID=331113 RepID=F8L3I0_SIMNZ|nr:hypothetical protein [Simkania negevensis]CCB89839.1 hypothetical protein SNE_A19620 [Simkania negevensis Z]
MSSTATNLESRVNTLLSSATFEGKEIKNMTVVEVAAQRVDHISKGIIGNSSTPRSLDERDLEQLSEIDSKEELDTFVKGVLSELSDDNAVRTLTGRYLEKIEARFTGTISHAPDQPDHVNDHVMPKADVVEIPVGSERKTVHMRKQLGLTGPSDKVIIKEKDQQTRLDDSFRDLAMLIQTDDGIDAYISGKINTIVIHRKDEASGQDSKVYYDLTHDSEIQRLLKENSGVVIPDEEIAAFREKLNKIGKELDEVMQEISPRTSDTPIASYSSNSVNNLNGADPFAHVGSRVGKTFMDRNFFEKSILPLFNSHGLTEQGKLNKHGIRAYKEIAAAITLRKQEANFVSLKLDAAQKKLDQKEKDTSLNLLDVNSPEYQEIEELKKQIKVLSQRQSELSQTSDFTVAWMLVQVNAPVEVTHTDGRNEKISVREALEIQDDKFTVKGTGFKPGGEEVTRLTFRQKLAAEATKGFNATVLKNSQGTFETDPNSTGFISKRFSQKQLTTNEMVGGFEMGTMFFYPSVTDADPDPTFRIQNQLRHERFDVTYSLNKDIPGGEWVKLAKHVVDSESAATLDSALEAGRKALESHFGTEVLTKEQQNTLFVHAINSAKLFSNPEEKTPENGLNILRDNFMVSDSRWFGKRWWDHGRGN